MEINKEFKEKKLLAWDSSVGQFALVSPYMLTTTIYTEDGKRLDDIIKVTPAEVIDKINNMLAGAPDSYNTFLEIANSLNENKDSITEILNAIASKVQKPTSVGGKGQVLALNEDGTTAWVDDKDTIYTHPSFHDPSVIKETTEKQFVSAQDKETYNNKVGKTDSLDTNKITINNKEEKLVDFLTNFLKNYTDFVDSKGEENGLATLDVTGKVLASQLPDFTKNINETLNQHFKNAELSKNGNQITLKLTKEDNTAISLDFPLATTTEAGLLSTEDKKKLDRCTTVESLTLSDYQALLSANNVENGVLYICG